MTPNPVSNPGCYARRLGDCDGFVNREHVVSRVLLDAVWQGEAGGRVFGLTFKPATPEDPAQLGINALTAKILCESHNHALNPFDTEIGSFFRAMERMVLAEISDGPIATNSYVRGDRVERWTLKTLINGLFSGNFPVPFVNSFKGQLPDDEALQIIYHKAPFPDGHGMYLAHEPTHFDHIVFRLQVVGDPTGIVGLRMWLMGRLFSLVLTDERGAFPELATATYRPAKIIGLKARNGIVISWDGQFTDAVLPLQMCEQTTY